MAIGLFMTFTPLVMVGAVLFSGVVLFQLVTLPVAAARVAASLSERDILNGQGEDLRRRLRACLRFSSLASCSSLAVTHV